MKFINQKNPPFYLDLAKSLDKSIKRGHPWLYATALEKLPEKPEGSIALIRNRQKKIIATGYYSCTNPIAVRICTQEGQRLDQKWAEAQILRAVQNRSYFKESSTNAFRLINGEGDGLPGLVCDIYNDHAVIQLDGQTPSHFWNTQALAQWLVETQRVNTQKVKVVLERNRDNPAKVWPLIGELPTEPVVFLENNLRFQANLVEGQKTGFFLDQRENRNLIKNFSQDKKVLNLFSYTGGFSVYAGVGQAREVTAVDIAAPAILEAKNNWQLNHLKCKHHLVTANVFDFLENSKDKKWDFVIVDPPSFARSYKSVDKATQSYKNLFSKALKVTTPRGLVALSSCSSHIDFPDFLNICQEALSMAQRRGYVINVQGQPFDHPFPLNLKEHRYLKFALIQLGN